MRPLHIGDDLLPEAHGLRVRVVDAEDRDAMRDPDLQDLSDRGVDSRVVVVEVQEVDILLICRIF